MVTGSGIHVVGGGHPAAHAVGLEVYRTGLRLFILSESMIFVLLLVVRFALAGRGHPAELSQPLAVLMTLLLVASGWPARRAVAANARGDGRRFRAAVWQTLALGGAFLLAMAVEWALLALGPASPYGTVFFTTTGFHGLHVAGGLLFWASVLLQARGGRVDAARPWSVEAAERYWRFVDVVWLFIYPVLYLL